MASRSAGLSGTLPRTRSSTAAEFGTEPFALSRRPPSHGKNPGPGDGNISPAQRVRTVFDEDSFSLTRPQSGEKRLPTFDDPSPSSSAMGAKRASVVFVGDEPDSPFAMTRGKRASVVFEDDEPLGRQTSGGHAARQSPPSGGSPSLASLGKQPSYFMEDPKPADASRRASFRDAARKVLIQTQVQNAKAYIERSADALGSTSPSLFPTSSQSPEGSPATNSDSVKRATPTPSAAPAVAPQTSSSEEVLLPLKAHGRSRSAMPFREAARKTLVQVQVARAFRESVAASSGDSAAHPETVAKQRPATGSGDSTAPAPRHRTEPSARSDRAAAGSGRGTSGAGTSSNGPGGTTRQSRRDSENTLSTDAAATADPRRSARASRTDTARQSPRTPITPVSPAIPGLASGPASGARRSPIRTRAEMEDDRTATIRRMRRECDERGGGPFAGPLLVELLRFATSVLKPPQKPTLDSNTWATAMDLLEALQDAIAAETTERSGRGKGSRSADGILQADTGVFPLTEGCSIPTLHEALRPLPKGFWSDQGHWMCPDCKRPSDDPYTDHMTRRHPDKARSPPPALTMDDILNCVQERAASYPACTVYSMETPLYRAANKAMREYAREPEAFAMWRGFAALLEFELQQIERFVGSSYRAVDCTVPSGLYQRGGVVTWNQPSSASTSPKMAKLFLRGGGKRAAPSGTLFIIKSATSRPISQYSVHPEEAEVLFTAGTQFQVCNRADAGLKDLLEVAMRCKLDNVEVYELRELTLDSWCDLAEFLDPVDRVRNQELLDCIDLLPKRMEVRRNTVKEVCVEMTSLITRPEDGMTALHLAATVPENLGCVQLISSRLRKEDFSRRDAKGRTALQLAVEANSPSVAVYLLHRGAGLDQLTPIQQQIITPWIAMYGSDELVMEVCAILKRKTSADARAALQEALFAASYNRSRAVMEALLAAGAPIPQEKHPLAGAAGNGNLDVVLMFVERGDVNTPTLEGQNALMCAAAAGQTAVVRVLLDARADFQRANSNGYTPLILAAQGGHVEAIRELLAARADVAAITGMRWTALMAASQNGHVKAIQALLKAGADVHAADRDGVCALLCAAQNGHTAAVQELLQAKADVHAADRKGWTALQFAADNGNVAALKELVRSRADVNGRDKGGGTALIAAAQKGQVGAIQGLLQARADVNLADNVGHTALSSAAQTGHANAIRDLLTAGADANPTKGTGATPLMLAAENGHSVAIQLLLNAKADVQATDEEGWTSLMSAAQEGHIEAVTLLLKHSADPNAATHDGTTALMSAAANGHTPVLALLVRSGANLEAEDGEGFSALTHAVIKRHEEAAQYMRNAYATRQ